MMRRLFPRWFLLAALVFILSPMARGALADDTVRATLRNGLRVVIVRNTLAPVVTAYVNYLVGSNETPSGFPGMAHALEHMMYRGSPGLSAGQLSALIASLGGEFNADTQQTVTQYFSTVPAENLDTALHIEAIRMRGILDTPKLWEEERGAIEQEVAQDLSNPLYLLESRLLAEMFAGTPYAHDSLGTRDSFEATTAKMVKTFHGTWYAPNNAVLVVVGDVDPARALKTVKRLFDPIPSRPLPERPAVELKPHKTASIELETDLPYAMAVVAYRLPGYDSPDYAAGQILVDVLADQRGNLYALVPEGKALSADFDTTVLPRAAVGYAMVSLPAADDVRGLASRIQDIVADYAKNGFPEELVEAAKRREIADAEFQRNSIDGLAALWSEALAVEGRASPEDDIDAIRKVTTANVNRVGREYLVNDTAITAVLTPRPSGRPVSSAAVSGKESFAPKQVKTVTLPAWAKKAAMLPQLPSQAVSPTLFALENGLRLIVQPETVSPTVTLLGEIKNNPDLETPKGKEGVEQILGGLFQYGTLGLNRFAFLKEQDDIAADLSVGTSFSLRVLSEHFERGAELLAENLLHPALPEEAFTVVKQKTIDSIRGLQQSASFLADRALDAALYPEHDPVQRRVTPETVAGISLDDVREYHHTVFRPDMTTIVVIGRTSPEQAKAVIEKFFGGWKAVGTKPETDLPPVPPNRPSATAVPDTNTVQTEVTLSETLELKRSDPDYYALQVGNHVLSGGFYATRLYRDLREKTGLVYSVDSFLEAEENRSVFGVTYACDPDNVSKARALVEHNLRDMRTTPVSQEELRQAKTLLIRQILLSESSTDNIAETLLGLSLNDLQLDEPVRAAKRYREMTALEVKAAFYKWIRPADFVQITRGPEAK